MVDLNSGSYFWDPSTGNLHEKVSDTELLFDFYKVYEETTNVDNKESFEEFISWGKTLIKDFNEILNS